MERPNNVPRYDDIDLKLGIKSSLPNVKETLALFLLMWRSCGKAAVLDYCVSSGDNLEIAPALLGDLHTTVRNACSEEECSFEQLDALISNNQMFKSQLEALIVAFELVWKIAKIRFVDNSKPSSAERTGGKRYPKRLWFTINMDLIDILFLSAPKDYTRVLLKWLGTNIVSDSGVEKNLLQILTVFAEGAVYKLIDGENDVIFNLNSLYEKLLSSVDELDINGDKEAKGSLRVLKSALSDGMNPYLKYKSGIVSLSEDPGLLQQYSDRVDTFLSLSTSKVLGLDEGAAQGAAGGQHLGAAAPSESYIEEDGATDIALNTILYGPPGTGKTYHTVIYAVAIIENRELASVEAEDYSDVLNRYHEYKAQGRIEFTTFHQSYGYEEFIEGIKPAVDSEDETHDIEYSVQPGIFKRFCECADDPAAIKAKNYVFIIDEINRGNISKVFGELITLIEGSKRVGRPEGMEVVLPYSQKLFGVPQNVYIIGTMNTADRSIATIDTALRRRFVFQEMLPDASVLDGIEVGDLRISELLIRMNKRISALYDREHTIGHAYFMPLRDDPTIEKLAEIFANNIIPLLQEYFYEDYEKIRFVLGDNRKTEKREQFVVAEANNYSELFGEADIGLDESSSYAINKIAFHNPKAYHTI